MIERPFPCKSDEVRAIRANLKTQSRSLRGLQKINAEPDAWEYRGFDSDDQMHIWHSRNSVACYTVRCPRGVAGDRLWVQETWAPFEYSYEDTVPSDLPSYCHIVYRVDCKPADDTWRSSTQMPRWASRDTLENVSVKPERLQVITEADAMAEGCERTDITLADIADFQISDNAPHLKGLSARLGAGSFTAKFDFMVRWDSKYDKTAPWTQNKWVWRIEHRRVNER